MNRQKGIDRKGVASAAIARLKNRGTSGSAMAHVPMHGGAGTSRNLDAPMRGGVRTSLFIGRDYLGKRSCLYISAAGERHFLANGEDVLRMAARMRMVVEFTSGSDERDVFEGAFCPVLSPSRNRCSGR